MKKFKCEEIMCGNCVSRIDKALTAAEIEHQVDLNSKQSQLRDVNTVKKKAVGDPGRFRIFGSGSLRRSASLRGAVFLTTVTCARSVPLIV